MRYSSASTVVLLTARTLFFGSCASSPTRPHIIHILADDVGWNDLGFVNRDIRTPHIDQLQKNGVQLTRFYAQKECAPSRSSIMTGRLPFRYGYYQNPSDDGAVPLNYTMLPQMLRQHGYRTHAIGKWHCGFRLPGHTPTHRGFDSFLGYWHWGEEYADHMFPPYYKDAKCRGVDFVNATVGGTIDPVFSLNGTLSMGIFLNRFNQVLQNHPGNDVPLYVYFAFQNAHDPYEHAPEKLVNSYSADMNPLRRNYSAIIEDLDLGVGEIVRLLKATGLWNNTLLWFNSDNGAELPFPDQSKCGGASGCLTTGCCGGAGNNLPLRGGKFTLFEGGIRSRTFLHGSMINAAAVGKMWPGLSHVSDIFATFGGLAGASVSNGAALGGSFGNTVGGVVTDGFDLWDAIMNDSPSPREHLLHQPLNMYWNETCAPGDLSNPFTPSCGASLTWMPWKIIMGFPGDARVVSLLPQTAALTPRDLCTKQPCLYNIEEDPSESHDLAEEHPEMVDAMQRKLFSLSAPEAQPQPADSLTPEPSDSECEVVRRRGAWVPWETEDGTAVYM